MPGIPPFARAGLFALLALWAALLFGGFAVGREALVGEGRMPRWARMASSLALVAAGWLWAAVDAGGGLGLWSALVAVGMSLGCLGDLLLAEVIGTRQPVLGGIGAFGLGHVAYLAALLGAGAGLGVAPSTALWTAWVLWITLGLVGWYLVALRGQKLRMLSAAALPYTLLLASVAGVAMGLAFGTGTFAPVAVGGALFLASDLLLALRLFRGARLPRGLPHIGDAIWLTYGPAQMLIVYGAGLALVLPGGARAF